MDSEYPYKYAKSACKASDQNRFAEISSYSIGSVSSDLELKNLIVDRPITVYVDASKWSPYDGGIFKCRTKKTNHAVMVVGWGEERTIRDTITKYWII